MSKPDVRVRLSAEGVKEVVDAFKRVQSEAELSKNRSASGFKKIGDAAKTAQKILIGLGAIKVAHSFVNLFQRSADLADGLGKLNQKTGITVDTLSTLSFAARTADVDATTLANGMKLFARSMDEYDKGTKNVRDATENLFGDAKALLGLNQDQRFLKIAEALGKLEPGARRTGLAMQFFGKSGAELLPLIDDLADGGLEKLRKKMEQLGLTVDKEFSEAARRAKDALTDLKSASEGIVQQFAAGFLPALADAAEAMTEAFSVGGVKQIKSLGEKAGEVLRWIIHLFLWLGNQSALVFSRMAATGRRTFELLDDLAHGRFKGAWSRFRENTLNDIAAIEKELEARYQEAVNKLMGIDRKPVPIDRGGDDSASDDEEARKEVERLAKERERLEERRRKAEQKLADARRDYNTRLALAEIKALEAIEKERYENGLSSLREYYAQRLALAEQQGKIEADALYQRILELQSKPLEKDEQPADREAEIVKLAAEFQAKVLENQTALNALKAEEARETDRHYKQAMDFEKKYRETQEGRFAAARAAIDEEATQLDELLKKLDVADTERERRVAEFRQGGYQQVDTDEQMSEFDALVNHAGAALDDLDRKRREISRQVWSGQIFAFQGEEQIMELERERLPLLQEIAAAINSAAITPEQIQAAQDFNERLEELAISSNKAALEMAYFKQNAEGALTSDLSNWFSTGISQADSFGDAMRSLASSVVESLRKIAAQMLATLMIQKMLSFLGGAAGGGVPVPKASGGLIRGPGTGTSDSIPARLSNYEYVVRSAVVKQPGVLDLLNTLNYGTRKVRPLRSAHFAAGGLVDLPGQSGSGKTAGLDATIGLDEGLLLKRLEASPEFHRVFVRMTSNNQKAMRQAIG
jgi:hypothetical protein